MNRSRKLLSLIAGASAFVLVWVITRPAGPGLDPDGMAYVFAARTLAHAGTLLDVRDHWLSPDSTRVLTRWPPAFPIAIAAPVLVGVPEIQSARLVMALAAAITFASLAWLVSGAVGVRSAGALAVLLAVTPAIAIVHENVLSEPMFLAALALTLACMARERPAPLASGAAAALASMVRYAGLGAVGAAVLWEFLRRGSARERVTRAALAAAPALVVNAWWWVRASHAGGRTAVRAFKVYGELGPTLREGGETMAGWLAPGIGAPWGGWIAIVVLLAAGAVVTAGIRRAAREHANTMRLVRAAALLAAGYAGLVLAARVIADPGIPLDERLLAPFILLASVIAGIGVSSWSGGASRRARAIAGTALAAWGLASLGVTVESVRYALETGDDYADRCWVESPVTQWVRAHGDGHALVSNANVALFFQAGRLARGMPDDAIGADSARMFVDSLAARHGLVVVYDRTCAPTIDQPDSLVAALKLQLVQQLPTGSIWSAPLPPSAPR